MRQSRPVQAKLKLSFAAVKMKKEGPVTSFTPPACRARALLHESSSAFIVSTQWVPLRGFATSSSPRIKCVERIAHHENLTTGQGRSGRHADARQLRPDTGGPSAISGQRGEEHRRSADDQ